MENASHFGISANRAVNYHSDHQGTQLNYEVLNETICQVRASHFIPENWKQRIDKDYINRKGI